MSLFGKPSFDDLLGEAFRDAQVALLNAEGDYERAKHNLALQKERFERLQQRTNACEPEKRRPADARMERPA